MAANLGLAAVEDSPANDTIPLLDGPDVVKLNWSVRSPQVADLNNDGLMDVALVNNNQAKVEFLLQKKPGEKTDPVGDVLPSKEWEPILEHDLFNRSFTVIGQNAFDLELEDFNGDGRIDLAITGSQDPFSIYLQQEDGSFEQDWTFETIDLVQRGKNLLIEDLDRDGHKDVILLGTENIVILHKVADHTAFTPTFLPIEENAGAYLQLTDIDLNGRTDLVYLVNGINTQYIGIRLQDLQGAFGPEIPIPFDYTNFILMEEPEGEPPVFGIADPMSGMIRAFHILPTEERGALEFSQFPVKSFNSSEDRKHGSLYAFADTNNDGLLDLTLGSPERAEVVVYRQSELGHFLPPQAYPSFRGLTSIAFHQEADGSLFLLQLSDEEKLLGISPISEDGDIPFPSLMPIEHDPVQLVQWPVQAGKSKPLVLSKNKRTFYLNEYSLNENGAWQAMEQEVEDIDSDPEDIFVWKSGNGRPSIMVCASRDPVVFLQKSSEGTWETLARDSSLRKAVMNNLKPVSTQVQDLDGDGTDEILLAEDGFTRVIAWNPEKADFEIKAQFNAPQKDQSMIAPIGLDWLQEDTLSFYDPKPSRLYLLDTAHNTGYAVSEYIELPAIRLLFQRTLDLGQGHLVQLLAGENRFHIIDPSTHSWKVEWLPGQFTSGEDENRFHFLFPLKRMPEKPAQWIIIDAKRNELFMLKPHWDEAWESIMEFKLFDSNARGQNQGGSLQPREINAIDFNLDGREDLLMLVHDRMLIYY